ncbi:MAG: hypothetical protein PVG39_11370 [Desulfobacteraceae bacterium]|jgi:hypothetical protein
MLGSLTSLTGGGGMQASLGAGPATSGVSSTDTTDYSGGNVGLTIAPSGVNIGSILQPFQGNPENGGYGMSLASRLGYDYSGGIIDATLGGGSSNLLLIGGGVLAAGLILVLVLKKRR